MVSRGSIGWAGSVKWLGRGSMRVLLNTVSKGISAKTNTKIETNYSQFRFSTKSTISFSVISKSLSASLSL